MKQSKFFLTAMALLSWSAFQSVSAHDLEINGIYYAVTSSTSVSVTFKGDAYDSYADEYKGDVIIPEKVSYSDYNFTVTGIGERAFSGCPSITSISIPNGVTSIGENAFMNCTGTLTMNCDVPSLSASNGRFYGDI